MPDPTSAALFDLFRTTGSPAEVRLVYLPDKAGEQPRLHVELRCLSPDPRARKGTPARARRSGPVTEATLIGCLQAHLADHRRMADGEPGSNDHRLILDTPDPR